MFRPNDFVACADSLSSWNIFFKKQPDMALHIQLKSVQLLGLMVEESEDQQFLDDYDYLLHKLQPTVAN